MSRQCSGLVVVLAEDVGSEEAEAVAAALRLLRGVVKVTPVERLRGVVKVTPVERLHAVGELVVAGRVDAAWRRRVLGLLEPEPGGQPMPQ